MKNLPQILKISLRKILFHTLKLRIILAKDKLESAQILFNAGKYRDAISRAYYAMFYATKALLIFKKEEPKTHQGISMLWRKYFVKTGLIDKNYSKMLSVVQEARTDADYREEIKITRKDAQDAIESARIFVKKMDELVKKIFKN